MQQLRGARGAATSRKAPPDPRKMCGRAACAVRTESPPSCAIKADMVADLQLQAASSDSQQQLRAARGAPNRRERASGRGEGGGELAASGDGAGGRACGAAQQRTERRTMISGLQVQAAWRQADTFAKAKSRCAPTEASRNHVERAPEAVAAAVPPVTRYVLPLAHCDLRLRPHSTGTALQL